MEEDIKILEEKIKEWEPYKNIDFPTESGKLIQKENQAIETLIKGYRELEEKNKQCIKAGDLERAVGFLMNRNDLSNYIPKSKIKEQIDENQKMLDKSKNNVYLYFNIALQKLMEDK